MSIEIIFTIYALFFRIGVMITGLVSIFLGYKLYCKGLYSEESLKTDSQEKQKLNKNSSNSDFKASFGGTSVTLKNAGPGTFFALFGLLIIISMILNGNPEMIMNKYIPDKNKVGSLTMRSENKDQGEFEKFLTEAYNCEKKNDINGELEAYSNALKLALNPLNEIACILLETRKDRLKDSLKLIDAAIVINPKDADFWDTKANILYEMKSYKKAYEAIDQASTLDFDKYAKKVSKYKKMIQ